MHIAINGWFWDKPYTGSGQYLRWLTRRLPQVAPDIQITLIMPKQWTHPEEDLPPGVTIQTITLGRTGNFGKAGFEQQIFPQIAGEVGADIAHVPYLATPLQSPIPIVVTIHDLIPLLLPAYKGGILSRLYTSLAVAAARGAAAVIAVSEAAKHDISTHTNIPQERIHVVHQGVSPAYSPDHRGLLDMGIQQKYELPDQYVLYLGGYDVRKNIPNLLKAYTYVVDGIGDTHPLVLAGRLPERITPRFDNIPALIDEMELGDVVQLIGEVDEADKPTLYRMARVFVFPSYYEGFGLPVLEAMACGTPVVASNQTSIPEIAGEAAFLVDPDDARRMAGSIIAHITQENVYEENRTKGLDRAAEFSWQQTASETLRVYQSVLS